jgi:MFS family permease
VRGLGPLIAMAALSSGIAMIGFALATNIPLSMAMAAVGGFGMIITFASSNTVLQTMVDDDMRGRLMSFFVMAIMGTAPIGSLIAGWLADRFGETRTVIACGAVSIAAASLFIFKLASLRAMIRPIYVKKGIIPEVASGLTTANMLEEE